MSGNRRSPASPGSVKKGMAVLFTVLLLSVTLMVRSQGNTGQPGGAPESYPAGSGSLDRARSLVLAEEFNKAIMLYAELVAEDTLNSSLSAEFAYALALEGVYDGALARLDRVWSMSDTPADAGYFASQVFSLMGYDDLAGEFIKKYGNSAPAWVAASAAGLLEAHRNVAQGTPLSGESDVVLKFKNANRLAARNSNMQSLALFEEIIREYPEEYLPYVGYSIALENAGLTAKAAQAVEKALDLAVEKEKGDEVINMLNQRLARISSLQETSAGVGETKAVSATGDTKRYMAYAGGMISQSYINLNARLGIYKKGVGSTSLDLGFGGASGAGALTIGMTTYVRQKVLVGGTGVEVGFGGGTTALNLHFSAGLSFMNREKSASWDIFLDGRQTVVPKGSPTTVGFSFGRSIYFGKR